MLLSLEIYIQLLIDIRHSVHLVCLPGFVLIFIAVVVTVSGAFREATRIQ